MKFSEAIKDKPVSYYAFQLLYWTGIRCGELLALTRKDFDLDKRLLYINKSLQVIKGEEVVTSPKTEKSNRQIELPVYDPANPEATSMYRIPKLDANGKQKTRVRKGKGTEYLWVRISIPANDWNDRTNAEKWRKSWAYFCNLFLDEKHQINHRSYKRQGIEKLPSIHEGYVAREKEKSGRQAERCQLNREIRKANKLHDQIRELANELTLLITKKARAIYDRYKEFRRSSGNVKGSGRDGHDRLHERYRCNR